MFSGHSFQLLAGPGSPRDDILQMLSNWSDDTFDFVRHQVPRIVAVLIIAFILMRLLKVMARHLTELSTSQGLPSGLRAQQLRTVSSVVYSVGLFVIVFVAALQILPLLGIDMGPLLASAGIVGIAIGFGAQTLVRDFINGFFILVENQYDIGDTIKVAGVQGAVESVTLRRTVLRDGDGTVHNVPSSEIKVVSNLTRDWTQLSLHISVAYATDSDQVIRLLQQVGEELAEDPAFSEMIVARPTVLGIEKVSGDEVDYLMLVKTRPGTQDVIRRELRRRIKACFEKNQIQPGNPNRVYVVDTAKPA
ncbi:MAG TPA: mechanosensitive ion channel family protein [Candidatus Binatia bacterium]|nr:mechanosensitive ion channel family protein [Candidatus Binatia bacterium]